MTLRRPTVGRVSFAAPAPIAGVGGAFEMEFKVLCLSRMKEQVITIGPDIEVKILDIRGDKVRLGITAPRGVAVDRKEVAESKKQGKVKRA